MNNLDRGMLSLAKLTLDANIQIHVAETMFRKALIDEALRRTSGNNSKAARLLGIHRNTLLHILARRKELHGAH
jgi:DNA-binding protein Fis